MIYDTNSVDSVLICKNCEADIDTPKSLPCGEVICSHCESSIRVNANDNMFDCPVCQDKHQLPKNGLPICKPLLKMLAIKPIKLSRDTVFNSLENYLEDIQKKRN